MKKRKKLSEARRIGPINFLVLVLLAFSLLPINISLIAENTKADGYNTPPVAIAEPPLQIINVGETAWFSGNGSYDPDGYIVSYDWDFGDGTNGTGVTTSHVYANPGSYFVNLTVTDNGSATDSTCVQVIVEEGPPPENMPPVAIAEPPLQIIKVGETAWFSGNGSYDPDGYIVSYDWDFGDGTNGTGITTSHVYTNPGDYFVTLTVTDNGSATDSTCVLVIVEKEGPPPENMPPVAIAEPPLQIIYVGEKAWFSGNGSFDPDGYIVSYDWDFGDGTNGTGITTSHVYTVSGNYTVPLTVTDDDGATDTDTVVVIVLGSPSENQPPVAIAEPKTQTIYVGESAWFSGNGSFDPDGYIVSYDWDFGDGTNGTGATTSHVYTTAGDYTVLLMVTDNDGLTDNDTCSVSVLEMPPPPPPGDDDWPMFNHDPQHTGFSTSDAPDNSSLLWTFNGLLPMTSPSIADGMVFVVHGEPFVCALNESTGATIWSHEIPDFPSQPVVANGKVFVSTMEWGNKSDEVHIYCFDEVSGKLIWEWDTNELNLPPILLLLLEGPPLTAANDHLYFGLSLIPDPGGLNGSMIICLDDSTGDIIWTVSHSNQGLDYMNVPLTIANNMIFVCSGNQLYALDENNGNLLWTFYEPGPTWFESAPAVVNGKLFIGGDNTDLFYCLSANTGDILWQISLNGSFYYTTPAVAYDKVFVGANEYGGGNSTPEYVDPIFALDQNTGEILWRYDTSATVISSPAVADNKVFNSYDDGTICALDAGTGSFIWTYLTQPPSWLWHQSLAIAYGKLFASMGDILYVFGPGGTGNQPPVAIAEPPLQIIKVGEVAWFSGNGSFDPDGYIVSYDWDFGDGTFGKGATATHVYTVSGNYTVTLTVTDDDGATDSTCVLVIVEKEEPPPENMPPVAIAEPPLQIIKVGEAAWFTGNASYDPDGYIVSYDWDFGDGINGTGVTTTHVYTDPGGYFVTLTVTDNGSATDSTCVQVIVEEGPPPENMPPVAIAEPPLQIIKVGETAWFSGNGSYDPDGYIVSYNWDFGDGTNGTGITTSHVYTNPGDYFVTLTVTDNGSATGSTCVLVIVEKEEPPPENIPPVAIAEPPLQIIKVGETAWFSGNGSYDPDGYIVSYDWDFGDGTNGSGITTTHMYTNPGFYFVTLTVTDNGSATGSTCVLVIVEKEEPPPENIPPVAIAEPPLQIIKVGETAWFSGNGSFDPDGYIVSYDWDFGDGTFGKGATTTHVYTVSGNYTVTLTVTDDDGATDTDTVVVIVLESPSENQPPVAIAEPKIQTIYVGESAWFSGNGSFDPDGYIVSYDWDFGDGTNGSGVTISHVYTMAGNYTVMLTVIDDNGATDTDTVIVIVQGLPPENKPPVADAGKDRFASPLEKLTFNGNGSFDLDGVIVSYEWDFGDGGTAKGMIATHSYTDYETYIVTLTVADDEGATDTETCIVFVTNQGPGPIAKIEHVLETELPIPGPIQSETPMLILTAGLINMATFEEKIDRTVPVEVMAYYGDVHNVHIELIDDGGLEIEIIPIVRDVYEGQLVRFYLKIMGPKLPDDSLSTGITIKLKAVGNEAESNIEHVDVIIKGEKEKSSSVSEITVVSTAGTISLAAILAVIIGRRLL